MFDEIMRRDAEQKENILHERVRKHEEREQERLKMLAFQAENRELRRQQEKAKEEMEKQMLKE